MATVIEQAGKKVVMMGNEAVARGAIEGGVEVVAAYPGTPSSEVTEVLSTVGKELNFHVEWSANEKVAFEVAAGASLVGRRAIVAMKNAGLNVAMDTFYTLAYGGTKGGFLVYVADDPGAHYSSTEQDTRYAAMYAELLCLEPSDQQESKDMAAEAFDISEALEIPIVLRSVTRIAHGSGDVLLGEMNLARREPGFNKHYKLPYRWNVYGPGGAVSKHRWLHGVLPKMVEVSEKSSFNRLEIRSKTKLGVIASGLGYAYVQEVLAKLGLEEEVSLLKLGVPYPVPREKVLSILGVSEKVLVVEEGDPVVEMQVRSLAAGMRMVPPEITGKIEGGALEPYGELNPDLVAGAVRKLTGINAVVDAQRAKLKVEAREIVTPRSSTLCAGCPHLGSYWALRQVLRRIPGKHIVNGDIGCYEQGGYGLFSKAIQATDEAEKSYRITSPYEVLDTIYVMGSGIGMAQGQAQAGYDQKGKVFAVAGDSTFFHAALSAVANAAYNNANITFLVFDNRWTAMTGHQPSPTTGVDAVGDKNKELDIEAAARALGIDFVKRASAFDLKQAEVAIREGAEHEGPAVVILDGECALQVQRRQANLKPLVVVEEDCTGCKQCVALGCPAITYDVATRKAGIDGNQCVSCVICQQTCPTGAIKGVE